MAQVGNIVFQISADLKGLQGQLKTMESGFQSSFAKIEASAKSLGSGLLGALGIGFSVGAVAGFGREIIGLADNLQNLHDQTKISVELLSGIKSPLEEAGSSLETFAKGVFNLQKNLGNADDDTDKVGAAVKRLGLNLNDLRNSSPDEFIKKITDGLGKIENPVERNTVMFNLLGKSAKELGPALEQLAGRFDELRAKGLSAADVKALDDVGDALTRLKNQALVLGAEGVAGMLRFFGTLRDVPKIGTDLAEATKKFSSLSGIAPGRVEGMTSKEIIAAGEKPGFGINPQALRMARDEVLNLREEFNRLNGVNISKPQAAFHEIGTKAKSAKTEVDNFLEGLTKQLDGIQNKTDEALFGPNVALLNALNRQLDEFKEKLRSQNLPVPKGLDEFFGVLRDKIVGADQAMRDLNDSLEEGTKRRQAFADEANDGIGIQGSLITKEQAARTKAGQDQIDELRRRLTIDSIDTKTPEGAERKRLAQIRDDYEQTIKKIQEFGLQAGLSNEQTADLVAMAWTKSLNEINNKTDEVTEFQRRAMERLFDTFANLTTDVLAGNVKNWQDFGSRVKKVIDEIAAEWLTLQLKTAVLGDNFGKSGSGGGGGFQLGGLLGKLVGFLGFGGGGAGSGLNAAQILANEYHSGGIAGDAYKVRSVNPDVFMAARRYHTGSLNIGANEVPAILQRGEKILPRGMGMTTAGSTTIVVNNPQFQSRQSEQQTLARLGKAVKNANRNL